MGTDHDSSEFHWWRERITWERIKASAEDLTQFIVEEKAEPEAVDPTAPPLAQQDRMEAAPARHTLLPAIIAFVDIENSVGLGDAVHEEAELSYRLFLRTCAKRARDAVCRNVFVLAEGEPFTNTSFPRVHWFEKFTGDGVLACLQPWVTRGHGALRDEAPALARRFEEARKAHQRTFGWIGPLPEDAEGMAYIDGSYSTHREYRFDKHAVALGLDLLIRYVRALKVYWLRAPFNAKRIREGRRPFALSVGVHVGWVCWLLDHTKEDKTTLEPEGVDISYAARLQGQAKGNSLINLAVSTHTHALIKRYRLSSIRFSEGEFVEFKGLTNRQRIYRATEIRPVPYLDDVNPDNSDYVLRLRPQRKLAGGKDGEDCLFELSVPARVSEKLRDVIAGVDPNSNASSPRGDLLLKAHGRGGLFRWAAVESVYSLMFDRDSENIDHWEKKATATDLLEAPWGINRVVRLRRLSAAHDLLSNTELARDCAAANAVLAQISSLTAVLGTYADDQNGGLSPAEQGDDTDGRSRLSSYAEVGFMGAKAHLRRAQAYLAAAIELAGKRPRRFERSTILDSLGYFAHATREAWRYARDKENNTRAELAQQLFVDYLGSVEVDRGFRRRLYEELFSRRAVPGGPGEDLATSLGDEFERLRADVHHELHYTHSFIGRAELLWLWIIFLRALKREGRRRGGVDEELRESSEAFRFQCTEAKKADRCVLLVSPRCFGERDAAWAGGRGKQPFRCLEVVAPTIAAVLVERLAT